MKSIICHSFYLFAAICQLLCSQKAKAQLPDLVFETLLVNNQQAINEVKQVYQDTDGFIWLATYDGLYRYDGYQYKTYKSNLYTPNLLTSNKITAIVEDRNKNLWVGTEHGINRINKRSGAIWKVPFSQFDKNVDVLLCTNNGTLWVGNENGLCKYQSDTEAFQRIVFPDGISIYNIKTLAEDARGDIWIGTWSSGLYRYNPQNNTLDQYPRISAQNSAHIIYPDKAGRIWIGSWDAGLFLLTNPYQPAQSGYINFSHNKQQLASLSDNIIYSILQDPQTDALLIGTRSGLSVLNCSKELNERSEFVNYLPQNTPHAQRILPYNEINSIICDQLGTIWLGTIGGGVLKSKSNHHFAHYQISNEANVPSNSIRSLFVENPQTIWLGIGSYGLAIYNPTSHKIIHYPELPEFSSPIPMPTINAITQPSAHIQGAKQIWLGSDGQGIYQVNSDPQNKKVSQLLTTSTSWLPNNQIQCIREDHLQNLWVGTACGVAFYTPATETGTKIDLKFATINKKDHCVMVYTLAETMAPLRKSERSEKSDSSLYHMWLGTLDHGVICLSLLDKPTLGTDIKDLTPYRVKHYTTETNGINCDNIQVLYCDSKNRLWAGSKGGGLSVYVPEKDVFECVHQSFQLPSDLINNIIEDDHGDLWLTCDKGLIQLSIDRNNKASHLLYTTADGLQDNFFVKNTAFKSADGTLYFGGHHGYNSFQPNTNVKNQKTDFPIVLTDIKIANQSISSLPPDLQQKLTDNAPEYTRQIKIPYYCNNFSLEFVALTYQQPLANNYAYKLEGIDLDWQHTNAYARMAYYNKLPYGTYQFRIKASNANGFWNDKSEQIEIVVMRPPWLSWWAFGGYVTIVLLLLMAAYRFFKHRIQLKQEIEIEQIAQKKQEELNQAKLSFYTNITHELLTPLTIVSASLDELKILHPQYINYYRVMETNTQRLIRLLQQILEFRKMETGNLRLKVAKADLVKFIQTRIESFEPLMKQKQIHFSFICQPEIIMAYFDADKLDKILYNLLSNALKYNKERGYVQVEVGLEDKNQACIQIKDSGVGMSDNTKLNLFKRFYQDNSKQLNVMSTGIGLSLTKELIDLHNGSISVVSVIGEGTTFNITIPIDRSYYQDDQIANSSIALPSSTHVSTVDEDLKNDTHLQKTYSLLLIEDNDDLLQLMHKLLLREYNVHIASSAQEGLHLLEQEDIDLIVSDIMMPEMDGFSFCKQMKLNLDTSHIPIILLTAKNQESDRAEAYNAGADGFISKPFSLLVLHAKIKNLLKKKAYQASSFKKQLVLEMQDLNYTTVDEAFLKQAVACVQRHLADIEFDQQQFFEEMNTSKSTLYKKLKSLTGLNTSSFIRNIRLKAACQLINENKGVRISDLAYAVGFNDPKYFSACFKKEFGVLPSEYIER